MQGLFGNRYVLIAIALVIVLQLLFTYAPLMQRLFHTAALGWDTWLYILVVAFSVFILVELEKLLIRTVNR